MQTVVARAIAAASVTASCRPAVSFRTDIAHTTDADRVSGRTCRRHRTAIMRADIDLRLQLRTAGYHPLPLVVYARMFSQREEAINEAVAVLLSVC